MRASRDLLILWLPWSGLIGGLLGWGLQHQLGTYITTSMCERSGPTTLSLIGIGGAAIAAVGGCISARELFNRRHATNESSLNPRQFIAAVAVMSAALFVLTIGMQTAAAWIIPRCAS